MEPSRISAAEANDKISRGEEEILFIDTRNEKAWAESDHKLPGARRLAVDQVELQSHTLPRDRLIVTYCT
ncbi:MAG: rhodanese-like domain-containing protein [Candidatus Binatia bacterium]